jgi:competence protein ComEA
VLMFFSQYKKMIALCAIPIAVAVTFFGYQVIHAKATHPTGQTVNNQMQALLDGELKPAANPVATESAPPGASDTPIDSMNPETTSNPSESAQTSDSSPELNSEVKTSKSSSTAKPKPPKKQKTTKKPRATKRPTPTVNPNFKVNINRASSGDLEKLPGIGASKAKAIIAYREQSNAFKTLEELMKVKGIGPKIYQKIKDHLEL